MPLMARCEAPNDTLLFFFFLMTSKLKMIQEGPEMPCLLGKLANPTVSLRLEPFILAPEQKAMIRLQRSKKFPTTVRLSPGSTWFQQNPVIFITAIRTLPTCLARIHPAPVSQGPTVPASTYSVTYCQVLCQILYRTGIPVFPTTL